MSEELKTGVETPPPGEEKGEAGEQSNQEMIPKERFTEVLTENERLKGVESDFNAVVRKLAERKQQFPDLEYYLRGEKPPSAQEVNKDLAESDLDEGEKTEIRELMKEVREIRKEQVSDKKQRNDKDLKDYQDKLYGRFNTMFEALEIDRTKISNERYEFLKGDYFNQVSGYIGRMANQGKIANENDIKFAFERYHKSRAEGDTSLKREVQEKIVNKNDKEESGIKNVEGAADLSTSGKEKAKTFEELHSRSDTLIKNLKTQYG